MLIKFIKEHTVFVFIFASCVLLRLIPLFDYQFTLDELSGLDRTRFDTFGTLIEKGIKIDAHPALIQVIIYYLSRFFGYVTWIIKLPFLLFSFGSVIYAYFFCIRNFSKQVAIIAATIFSFSLVFVFYAPIARMYISGIFFSTALLYHFFEIFFLNNFKRSNYLLLGLFALLSAFNQHINALFAFTVCLSGSFFLTKENYKAYVITIIATVIAYLPHLPVTLYQLSIGGIGYEQGGWLEKPKIMAVAGFLKILFGTGRTYLIFTALIILSFAANKKINFNKKQLYLFTIFLINYLIVYLYSVYNASIYQNSIMLFSSIAIVFLVSSFLEVKNKYVFTSIFVITAATLILKTYYKKDYFHQCVKTVFEYQFERTTELKREYGDKNVYPIFFDADEVMKGIYFKKYHTAFDCKISSDSVTFSLKHFSRFVSTLKTDYVIVSSSYPLQDAIVKEYYPFLIENMETQGVNYKVFSRKVSDKNKVVENDKHYYASNIFNKGNFTYEKLQNVSIKKTSFQLQIDSLNEFPFDAKANLSEIAGSEGQVILATASFKIKKSNAHNLSVCISINDLVNNTNYNYNSKDINDFVVRPDSTATIYCDTYCGTNFKRIKDVSRCTVFIWNNGKQEVTLTDFDIKTIDFWPQKWHFWD